MTKIAFLVAEAASLAYAQSGGILSEIVEASFVVGLSSSSGTLTF